MATSPTPSDRTPRQVLDDHLSLAASGDWRTDLERNVADDIVVLTGFGLFTGRDQVRVLAELLEAQLPGASFGVRADDLGVIAATSAELDLPLHIHVSEQQAENEACLAQHGVSPVGLLSRTGVLGPRTTLVHATHLTGDDIDLIAGSGSIVCFCPTTEADLGDGIGPARELSEAGVPICLGSDSNAVVDILHEANRLEQHDRLRLMRRGIHSPESLAAMATTNGMRYLGWSGGGLASGSPADFIAVDPASPELVGTGASLAAVISAATRASVTDVVVAGIARKGNS
jgi:cytosine/adenosine deaminase-related metal-dependent hydrolase